MSFLSWILQLCAKKQYKTNERGFIIYGQLSDTKGSIVRVQESSSAECDAIWIFCDNFNPAYKDPSPHLNKEQVADLIELLTEAYNNMTYSVE